MAVPSIVHESRGLDARHVMEFGEPCAIYHGLCSCGYRTLGFGLYEAAEKAIARHIDARLPRCKRCRLTDAEAGCEIYGDICGTCGDDLRQDALADEHDRQELAAGAAHVEGQQ